MSTHQLTRFDRFPGVWINIKMPSYQYRKSIVEIRRSYDRLISTMGFPILVRWHLYIESGPWCQCDTIISWWGWWPGHNVKPAAITCPHWWLLVLFANILNIYNIFKNILLNYQYAFILSSPSLDCSLISVTFQSHYYHSRTGKWKWKYHLQNGGHLPGPQCYDKFINIAIAW